MRAAARNLALPPTRASVKLAAETCPALVYTTVSTIPVVTQAAVRGLRGAWQEAYCLEGEAATHSWL